MQQIEELAMNRDRFQDILDSRGSDLSAWPDADRLAAEHLIARDAEAAAAFEQARRLDSLIGRSLATAPQADHEDIASRILAGLPRTLPAQERQIEMRTVQLRAPRKEPKPWAFWSAQEAFFPRIAALGFAAAFGIAVGLFWAQNMDERQEASADAAAIIFPTDTAIGTF